MTTTAVHDPTSHDVRYGPEPRREKEFLHSVRSQRRFLTGAAAAGVTKLTSEIGEILSLATAYGTASVLVALERAVRFSRRRAADVRSILATNGQATSPTPAVRQSCSPCRGF
jgi:hypothetical protein